MVLGVIPARYGSTRFPGKPLARVGGKPLIQRVWEQVSRSRRLDRLLVATDDRRILDLVRRFGGEGVMTPKVLPSGTDRVWAAAKAGRADLIVNIQGDEPLVRPSMVDRLVEALKKGSGAQMATLRFRMRGPEGYTNPNIVKVVTDREGWALYFSRSPIPYFREQGAGAGGRVWYKHIGLYAYRRGALERFVRWPVSALEKAEGLEQLRALEHGVRIKVIDSPVDTIGVDALEDLKRVERCLSTSL